MHPLRILLVALAALALLVGGGLVVLGRYLDSAAFRDAVASAAREAFGAEVKIGEMRVSLFSGVALKNVVVGNPPGVAGDLLRADALVVRYRIWPLLRRRLEIKEMRLERPTVTLVRGEHGEWHHERRPRAPVAQDPGPAPRTPASGETPLAFGAAAGLDVLVPRLAVVGGRLVVTGERGKTLVRLDGLDLSTSLERVAGALGGDGQLDVAALTVADRLVIRSLAAPLQVRGPEARLAPVRATLADGTVSGDVALQLAGPSRYALSVDVRDARVDKLLGELGVEPIIRGQLRLRATLQGTGGLATLQGRGHADVRQGQLVDFPVLGTLASVLQAPFFHNLRFDEGSVEFALADGILRTPSIRFISRDVQMTGEGQVVLAAGTFDHRLTLTVPKSVMARAPREVRTAFTERPDGRMAMDFKLWGPYDAPKTDLSDRLLQGAAESLLKKGLKQLLR